MPWKHATFHDYEGLVRRVYQQFLVLGLLILGMIASLRKEERQDGSTHEPILRESPGEVIQQRQGMMRQKENIE